MNGFQINPSPEAPPGVVDSVNQILGYAMWAGIVVATGAMIIGGIVITLNAYGRAGDAAEQIVRVLGLVFIGAVIIGIASRMVQAVFAAV